MISYYQNSMDCYHDIEKSLTQINNLVSNQINLLLSMYKNLLKIGLEQLRQNLLNGACL